MLFISTVLVACGGSGTNANGTNNSSGGNGSGGTPPAPTATLAGTVVDWNGYTAIMPSSMVAQQFTDAVTMDSGTTCRITLWSPVAADADQDAQALAILKSTFGADIAGVNSVSPLNEYFHLQGISGEGWSYVELQGYLIKNNVKTAERVRILLAKLGDMSAAMTGYDNDYGCLTESYASPGKWMPIVHSLSFPNYRSATPTAMRDWLIGGWFGSTTSSVTRYYSDTFAKNSHYLHTEGFSSQLSFYPGDPLVYNTNVQWAGDGSWSLNGNKLTTWPSDTSKKPQTEYIRIFKQYKSDDGSGTITWDTYFMRLGLVNGVLVEQYATK
jgi:hypothetical protein